ncbi:hypothetical protein PybrP1_000285 [[Pythium] brassicae (nom. inval.)]|nr:hypothetical protein PybrP1_000285 [[Pythium] brassicae (nom. inval.)]
MWELEVQDAARRRRLDHLELQRNRHLSSDFAQRYAQHSEPKRFGSPPRETFCKDFRGRELLEEIDLHELELTSECSSLTNDSLSAVRRHFSLLQELHINECRHFTTPVLCQLWRDCARLHSLSARGCPAATDAFLQCVATTKRPSPEFTLRSLDVRQCKHVTSSGISYLATSTLKDLAVVSLSIGDCLEVNNMAFFGFETSSGLQKLKALNLCGLAIDETAVSWIMKGCRALERLNLSRCKTLTDFALLLLAVLVQPDSALTHLNLKACPLLSDVGIRNLFSVADEARRLKGGDEDSGADSEVPLLVLNLKDCAQLGDESMQVISRHCGRLAKLNLKGLRKLSDEGVMHIGRGCPSVSSLKLSGRRISAQSFQLLGRLFRKLDAVDVSERQDLDTPLCVLHLTAPRAATTQSLKQINLSATNVCDVGVSMMAVNCRQLEWINLSKLQELMLSNVKGITDRSLAACALTKLPLRALDLSSNTNITDAGVLTLCAACQEIQELRLKGCDRLSLQALQHCNDKLLPFTRPMSAPTLSQKIATGGASSAMVLASLPERHVDVLRLLARHYDSASVLQSRFRRWKQKETSLLFLSRRRLLRQSRAAAKIQACARRFLAWRRYLHLLSLEKNVAKIVLVQAHARGRRCRARVRVLRFASHRSARVIQRAFRPSIRAQLRCRNTNALDIQRVYRGFAGRQLYKRVVVEREMAAGARIWRWYRRCKSRQDFRRRSLWLVQKVRSIQGQWRKHRRRANLTKHLAFYRAMATRIQSVWRRAIARMLVDRMRLEMNAGALAIQRVYRGFRARRRVGAYRSLANRLVTTIQSHWRRFLARRAYLHDRQCLVQVQRMARYTRQVRRLRRVVWLALHKHRNEAATTIQRHVRGRRGRKRALLYRKIRNAKLARKGQNARHALIRRALIQRGAAAVIQHWVRRVQARRRMLKIRRWRRYVAARCIQRYTREWLRVLRLRQKREAKSHAAVNIQRAFRGHRGRGFVKAERHRQQCLKSARLLQRIYRGYRGRCVFKQVRTEKMKGALLLQRAFRSRHARKLYEISQAVAALKAKDKYEHSLRGWIDSKRNPMDELYRRAKLPREKAVLVALKDKWEANAVAEERAARKFRREYSSAWETANETIGNLFTVRRKLYGVTENVYASNREFSERQERQVKLKAELVDLHKRVAKFRAAIQEASASRRMLDGAEVFELLKAHGLFKEGVAANNQDDAD